MQALPRLLFALAHLGLVTAHAAENPAPTGDFVRFREDAKGAQLQTAIGTYRHGTGAVVELIGAIHIADKSYYETLNRRFTRCEALLYEMVGEPIEAAEPEVMRRPSARLKSADPTERDETMEQQIIHDYPDSARPLALEATAEVAARTRMSWMHPLYDTLKSSLALTSQLEGIDYTKRNFCHADMTAREFAAKQEERGETFLQLWWRSMQAQPVAAPESPGLLKLLEVLCRPDSPTELKRLLGPMFDQIEKVMAGLETEQGSVIVVERNKVALHVLEKQLAKGRKRLGIFYGAAHLPDMEKRLLDRGFKREKLEWLTAWDLPPPPPPLQGPAANESR
ncbi:MAG: hypothetical protein ACOYMN_00635 [Roseimicrobium sp.]